MSEQQPIDIEVRRSNVDSSAAERIAEREKSEKEILKLKRRHMKENLNALYQKAESMGIEFERPRIRSNSRLELIESELKRMMDLISQNKNSSSQPQSQSQSQVQVEEQPPVEYDAGTISKRIISNINMAAIILKTMNVISDFRYKQFLLFMDIIKEDWCELDENVQFVYETNTMFRNAVNLSPPVQIIISVFNMWGKAGDRLLHNECKVNENEASLLNM